MQIWIVKKKRTEYVKRKELSSFNALVGNNLSRFLYCYEYIYTWFQVTGTNGLFVVNLFHFSNYAVMCL